MLGGCIAGGRLAEGRGVGWVGCIGGCDAERGGCRGSLQ